MNNIPVLFEGAGVASISWENVTSGLSNLGSVMNTVLSTISSSPYLMAFMVAPLFKVGVSAVKKLIRVAR